jgi:predicted AAA+ superfamily ATPase
LKNLKNLPLSTTGQCELPTVRILLGPRQCVETRRDHSVAYLNDLISTFIERDVMQAAGIEKKSAFHKTIKLLAGSVGEVLNFSSLSGLVGVESPTVQSWSLILEQNKLIKILPAYMNNINERLIKMPKIYFEDVGLAIRLQGWSEFLPILGSPYYGHITENVAYSEISRFITNEIIDAKVYYLCTKEKVEVDFLIELPNKRYIAAEVKTTPRDFSMPQLNLIDSLKLNIIERWILTPEKSDLKFENRRVVSFSKIYEELQAYI